jgi:hypothetical protein
VHERLKTAKYSGKSEIPCFDGAFDSYPVAYLALDCLADEEAIKIQQHLPQGGKSETTSATPLGDSGHVSLPRDNAAGVVPSRQASKVSGGSDISSLDVEFGDKEDTAPDSWLTYFFTGVARSTLGFGGKDQGEGSLGTSACWTSLDNVAATPDAPDNGQKSHAVVLLGGYTKDKDGKNWYLMQNSWKSMPLFLASAEYLGACSVNAVFVKDRMEAYSTEYERTTKRYTECASPVATCKNVIWCSSGHSGGQPGQKQG